jgi:hypothetical protein
MPVSSADTNAFLAIGMQSGKGSAQTTATKLRFAKYLSGTNIQPAIDTVTLREGGDGHEWGLVYKRSVKAQGQLVCNARPEILGQILQLVPGRAAWDNASAPAGHTFDNGHASYPWATLFVQHPGSQLAHILTDTRITGLTIEGAAGEPIKVTAPFTAIQHGGSYAALTPTYASEDPFMFAQGSYQIDGTLATALTSFKVDFALSVEELQSGQITLDEIVVQSKDTSVEYVQRFEDPALWRKIAWGGGVTPTVSVATGQFRAVVAYGTGANLRSLDVFIPLVGYQTSEFTELDPDGKTVMVTTTGKALKGATHSAVIVLKNAHASAYAP